MKKYIVVGIMAAGLLASGCGKFVRDELITMQNEIDQIQNQVKQMNESLESLREIVEQMAAGGYVVDVQEFTDEDQRGGYVLVFNDGSELKLYSGVDGKDGKDAVGPAVSIAQDGEGRWCWTMDGEFLTAEDGKPLRVDGKDGVTPQLKIDEEGYWCLSLDNGETWEQKKDWPARGKDADEIFSLNPKVYDDRIELVLSATGETIVLPYYLPLDVELTLEGQDLDGEVLIAPGETLSIGYALTGAGAANALLVAGTDGRFKTAIKPGSDPESNTGIVEVTCPADNVPEGGYIYITVNDGNGRSRVKVIRFAERYLAVQFPNPLPKEFLVGAEGDSVQSLVTFKSNYEVIVKVVPEEAVSWLTLKTEVTKVGEDSRMSYTVVGYEIPANETTEARSARIAVYPKDHPDFEVNAEKYSFTITQAAKPAEGTGTGE
jgi:hypothetical protein